MGDADPPGPPDSFVPSAPAGPLKDCPIAASLGVVGRKWALLVLRDVTFRPGVSFAQIRRNNPGLGNRSLSLRLRQLQEEGLIVRSVVEGDGGRMGYHLTAKGRDLVPVLTAFMQYGIRHHADRVFEDGRARSLAEVLPTGREYWAGEFTAYLSSAGPTRERRPARDPA